MSCIYAIYTVQYNETYTYIRHRFHTIFSVVADKLTDSRQIILKLVPPGYTAPQLRE